MKSKFYFLTTLVLIIFSITVFPQSFNDTLSSQPDKLHTFNVYLLNGYALSYEFSKYDQSLFRVQLDFSSSYNQDKMEGERSGINSSGSSREPRSEEYRNSSVSVSLSAHYIYSLMKNDLGELYIGAGPLIGFSRNESISRTKETIQDTIFYNNSSNNREKNYSLGLIFAAGIKAFLTDNISIFSELNLSGGKRWKEDDYISSSSQHQGSINYSSTNNYNLSGGGWFYNATYVRLGISISI